MVTRRGANDKDGHNIGLVQVTATSLRHGSRRWALRVPLRWASGAGSAPKAKSRKPKADSYEAQRYSLDRDTRRESNVVAGGADLYLVFARRRDQRFRRFVVVREILCGHEREADRRGLPSGNRDT